MKISIVTPTYNEEKNIPLVIQKVKNIMSKVDYDYEHLIIDNNSIHLSSFVRSESFDQQTLALKEQTYVL